jgi:glycerol-3-phosphate acyltransferase PlsX
MAADEYPASIIVVGDREVIEKVSEEEGLSLDKITVVHAASVIDMEDSALSVVREKNDSSMSIGLKMLAQGEGDAFVSAGNTGALFTGATLIVRKLKGLQRAAIGTVLPFGDAMLLMDSGANVTVTDEVLEQFAVMGSAYMRAIYHVENPRVGLLNNGTEECKGTELQQSAYQRLKANSDINFIGNVEGGAAPAGVCDVLVTDGFTGNIFLKTVEGVGKMMFKKIKATLYSSIVTKIAALMIKKPMKAMKKELDPSELGGAPILGISKPVVKAHGSSDAKAFKNAIRQVIGYAESGAIEQLTICAAELGEKKKARRESEKSLPIA